MVIVDSLGMHLDLNKRRHTLDQGINMIEPVSDVVMHDYEQDARSRKRMNPAAGTRHPASP